VATLQGFYLGLDASGDPVLWRVALQGHGALTKVNIFMR
jgi:hypothetical protein